MQERKAEELRGLVEDPDLCVEAIKTKFGEDGTREDIPTHVSFPHPRRGQIRRFAGLNLLGRGCSKIFHRLGVSCENARIVASGSVDQPQ